MRATSTVVDVSIFLVLVSVAVVSLSVPLQSPPEVSADDVAETLATATTVIEYDYGVADATVGRTATGTYAGLLGHAALARLSLDGHPIRGGTGGFVTAVKAATGDVLAWTHDRTLVVVVWEPYTGSPLRGTLAVGTAPPPVADVAVTTVRTPVPVRSVGPTTFPGSVDSYRVVADAVAGAVVAAVLPTTGVAYGARGSVARSVAIERFRAFAAALDVTVDEALAGADPGVPAARVREALAERLLADMRSQFDSPAQTVAALRTGYATVIVKEWEA